ncbi:hypothetical protein GW16_00750 [Xanthomonas arboricola pv. celebensis]|nr:hypothetical protein GW16_00750 [Xanthomonas arboricola pv. celebensis]
MRKSILRASCSLQKVCSNRDFALGAYLVSRTTHVEIKKQNAALLILVMLSCILQQITERIQVIKAGDGVNRLHVCHNQILLVFCQVLVP